MKKQKPFGRRPKSNGKTEPINENKFKSVLEKDRTQHAGRVVLFIHQFQHIGGGQTYTDAINDELRAQGYRVILLQTTSALTIFLHLLLYRGSIVLWSIYQEFPIFTFFIAHITGWRNYLIILNVWTKEAASPKEKSTRKIHLKVAVDKWWWWSKQLLVGMYADGLAHLSAYSKTLFFQQPGYAKLLKRKNSVIIQGGADRKIFHPIKSKEKKEMMKRFGLRSESTTILMAGRIDQRKNYEDGFKVFQRLISRRKSNHLFLYLLFSYSDEANDLSYFNYLLNKIHEYGIANQTRIISGIDHGQIAAYYQLADAFLMTSRYNEPFGLVSIESIACGCPVFGYRSCAMPEIISYHPDVFLAKTADIGKLTQKLNAYLDFSPTRKQRLKKGLLDGIKQYRWRMTTKKLTSLFSS